MMAWPARKEDFVEGCKANGACRNFAWRAKNCYQSWKAPSRHPNFCPAPCSCPVFFCAVRGALARVQCFHSVSSDGSVARRSISPAVYFQLEINRFDFAVALLLKGKPHRHGVSSLDDHHRTFMLQWSYMYQDAQN